jgi:hypothetical protein
MLSLDEENNNYFGFELDFSALKQCFNGVDQ